MPLKLSCSVKLSCSTFVALAALAAPASAQVGAQGLPDLSGIAGAIASAAAPPPAPVKGKPYHTTLTVPSVHPGASARDVDRQFREAVEKQTGPNPAMRKVEAAMPSLLTSVEASMEAHGLAKRDLGVALGVFFVQNWEMANKRDLSDATEAVVVRSVAAVAETRYKTRFDAMTPAIKEKIYEQMLGATSLTGVFVQAFDKAGKAQEATALRQSADALFKKVVGTPATQVGISADGRVTDLKAAGGTDVHLDAPAPSPAP